MKLADKYFYTSFDNYDNFAKWLKLDVPDGFNFGYDIVDVYAESEPDKLALLWCDDNGRERRFTFGELKRLTDKAANYFSSLGLKKGDMVMTTVKRRWHFWVINVALCKMGVTLVPATFQLTEKDFVYRINAAGVKMVLTVDEPHLTEAIEAARDKCPTLEYAALVDSKAREGWLDFDKGLEEAPESWERVPTNNSDIMLIYFTSGTTGMPKMVTQNMTYPIAHAVGAVYWHNTDDTDLHITVADTGWAKCSWGKIYGQWIAGTAQFVYDMEKFVPEKLAAMLEKYKVTSFCAPPTIYRFLIKTDLAHYDLSHIRRASTAGEPLNPEVYKQFLKLFGVKIYEGYGQTESTPIFANFKFDEPMPGSLGKPNPIYDITIMDEEENFCELGEDGEVCIKVSDGAPVGLFNGYYRDEERTSAVWHDGWYHTGDTVWQDEEGYYWFIGRADDVIKSSGYRIGPFEVESALMSHPSVLECAISAAPDPTRGQVVKATIVLAKGFKPSEELKKELQDHVKHTTAPYKYPRIVEFVDELPKTLSGKIRRKQLRQEAEEKARAFREALKS